MKQNMKQLVLAIFLQLMRDNGTTTSLEVKNAAHDQNKNSATPDPDFELRQSEVSDLLKEFYADQANVIDMNVETIERQFVKTGQFQYFVYRLEPVVQTTSVASTGSPSVQNNASNGTRQAPAVPASPLGNAKTVGTQYPDNLYVAFVKNDPVNAVLFQTTDKYEARAGLKAIDDAIVHEDVRMMKLKRFNNKY